MRRAVVISHVGFEDLGSLGPELSRAGYTVESVDACVSNLRTITASKAELLIVLGGPIGAYERETYPFLDVELDLISSRLAAKQPTLGICLGAQLIAAAAGASVYPGTQGKEIGWGPIYGGSDANLYPEFAALLAPNLQVFTGMRYVRSARQLAPSCCNKRLSTPSFCHRPSCFGATVSSRGHGKRTGTLVRGPRMRTGGRGSVCATAA